MRKLKMLLVGNMLNGTVTTDLQSGLCTWNPSTTKDFTRIREVFPANLLANVLTIFSLKKQKKSLKNNKLTNRCRWFLPSSPSAGRRPSSRVEPARFRAANGRRDTAECHAAQPQWPDAETTPADSRDRSASCKRPASPCGVAETRCWALWCRLPTAWLAAVDVVSCNNDR